MSKDLLEKGVDCYNRGELKKALYLFNEIIDVDGRNAEAFFYIANIFHLNGEIGKAIKAFNRVLAIEPTHTDAAISLSVLYNDIGHYEDAKKIFEQANRRVRTKTETGKLLDDTHINKKFAHKHLELADLYMTYRRYDEALFEYNKVIALDPKSLGVRIKLAKVYAKKGFSSKAQEELVRLKNEHPEFLDGRIALGVLYYAGGKVLEAQTEWQKVLSVNPAHGEAKKYLNLSQTATETSL